MPLIQVSLRTGKSVEYRRAIVSGVYEALKETFDVPEGDLFATIAELDAENFVYDRHFFDIERSDDFIIVRVTVSNTRTVAQKKALFGQIAARLSHNPGIRAEDVFISLVEVEKENWSFGLGIAQRA
jgi:phenylpyruvate tautomerase PptA (4-oxalocrotonate tautomerase family)